MKKIKKIINLYKEIKYLYLLDIFYKIMIKNTKTQKFWFIL